MVDILLEFLSRGRGNKEVHIYVCYCGNPGLLLYLFFISDIMTL